MKMNRSATCIVFMMSIMWGCSSCSSGDHQGFKYNPTIDLANFIAGVDNQYFPLAPGQTFKYVNTITEDGTTTTQDITITTTRDTKVILGVTCVVVHDVVREGSELQEDTWYWYSQDKDGNVWYFGEDTKKYENGGTTPDTEGSWEAGVNNAKPGIIMYAHPVDHVGMPYRQEYLPGVAEDKAEVLSDAESATVPYGSYTNCVMTKDYSEIEPDVVEHKYFTPGVGQVLTVTVQGGNEREELISITTE